jgi:hypothetical protein
MPLADIFNQRCEARNVKAPESCAESAQAKRERYPVLRPAGIYVCGMMVFPAEGCAETAQPSRGP